MIGRMVEVASDGVHLSVERGFLKLSRSGEKLGQVPLDDVAAVVVHGHGASFSANLCTRLAERGAPLVICSNNHSPVSIVWPVAGHHDQGRRMAAQAAASKPTKKRLWREIVQAKIRAQADALSAAGAPDDGLRRMARQVRSGDTSNVEAQAARRYWPQIMGRAFRRDRAAEGVNSLLNYGYTVLRAATSRSTLAAGLHPSLSIHHESRGEALRLADDLMEPFRPLVDGAVRRMNERGVEVLNTEAKRELAAVLTMDLDTAQGASPVQNCIDRLAISLAQVFIGERKRLEFPGPPLHSSETDE